MYIWTKKEGEQVGVIEIFTALNSLDKYRTQVRYYHYMHELYLILLRLKVHGNEIKKVFPPMTENGRADCRRKLITLAP